MRGVDVLIWQEIAAGCSGGVQLETSSGATPLSLRSELPNWRRGIGSLPAGGWGREAIRGRGGLGQDSGSPEPVARNHKYMRHCPMAFVRRWVRALGHCFKVFDSHTDMQGKYDDAPRAWLCQSGWKKQLASD